MKTAITTAAAIHVCGGTIVISHPYKVQLNRCCKCHAFSWATAPVPDGTDPQANGQAYDDGDEHSPHHFCDDEDEKTFWNGEA